MSNPNDKLELIAKLNGEVIAEHTCRPAPDPDSEEWAMCLRDFIAKIKEDWNALKMAGLGGGPIDETSPSSSGSARTTPVLLLILAAAVFSALFATSCTATGAPNWPAIDHEIESSASDLGDAAEWYAENGEPELAEDLLGLSTTISQIDEVVDVFASSGEGGVDARIAVEAAIAKLGKFAEKTKDEKAFGAAMFAKSVLKRVLYYLPEKGTPADLAPTPVPAES